MFSFFEPTSHMFFLKCDSKLQQQEEKKEELEFITETVIFSPCATSRQPAHHADASRQDEVHKRCIHASPHV